MKAILTTRCGCSRQMEIPYPAAPVIALPLRVDRLTSTTPFAGTWEKCVGQVRYFELVEGSDPGPLETAYYGEAVK